MKKKKTLKKSTVDESILNDWANLIALNGGGGGRELLLKYFPSPSPFSDEGVSKSYLIEMRRKRGGSGRFTRGNYQFILIYKNPY